MKHLIILFTLLICNQILFGQHTEIEFDSEGGIPQLLLTETGTGSGEFVRQTFSNQDPGFWTLAARTGSSTFDDDFNLFYDDGTLGFNILNVDGDLGVFNFESDLKINRNRGTDPNVIFDVEDGNRAEINFESNTGASQDAYIKYFAQQGGTAVPSHLEFSAPNGDNFLTMFPESAGGSSTFGPSDLGSGGGGDARLRVVHNSNANDGTLRLIENEATDFARMFFSNQGSSNRFAIASNPGNADPRMDLGFNGTSQLTIDGDDELVGVNTAPMYTMHVLHGSGSPGSGSDHGLNIENSDNDDSWTLYTRTSNGDLQLYYDPFTSPSSLIVPVLRGAFDAGDGAYTNTSDLRLKKNITTLENQLAKVLSLRPTRYQFKDNSNEPDEFTLGLIAQEVQKIIPEVVTQITDKEEDGMGYLGIAYSELIPVLIGAIQDQQEIIDSQKDQMTAMQSKIDDVLSIVASLSADTDDSLKTTSED